METEATTESKTKQELIQIELDSLKRQIHSLKVFSNKILGKDEFTADFYDQVENAPEPCLSVFLQNLPELLNAHAEEIKQIRLQLREGLYD